MAQRLSPLQLEMLSILFQHEVDGHPVSWMDAWFESDTRTLASLDRRGLIEGVIKDQVGFVVLTDEGIDALRKWVAPRPKKRGRPRLRLVKPSPL